MTRAEKDAARKQPRKFHMPIVWMCRLREIREKLGLTIRDVASGAGLSVTVLCKAENGASLSEKSREIIARYFGMGVEELWTEKK